MGARLSERATGGSVEIGDTLKCGPPLSAVYIIISLHGCLSHNPQRRAPKDTGTIASMYVLHIINEPTAAAVTLMNYIQRVLYRRSNLIIFFLLRKYNIIYTLHRCLHNENSFSKAATEVNVATQNK
jgi:hypothetical protein